MPENAHTLLFFKEQIRQGGQFSGYTKQVFSLTGFPAWRVLLGMPYSLRAVAHPEGEIRRLKFETPHRKFDLPRIKFDMPHRKFKTRHRKFDLPRGKFDEPRFKFTTPHLKFETAHRKFAMPHFKFETPRIKFETRHCTAIARRFDTEEISCASQDGDREPFLVPPSKINQIVLVYYLRE